MDNDTSKDPRKSIREEMLQRAIDLTTGPRNDVYGPPVANMRNTAELFNAYLGGKPLALLTNSGKLTATDVAMFMILAKVSRLAKTPNHEDSWTDIAAYAGIGLECAQAECTMKASNSEGGYNFASYKGEIK